MEPEVKFIEVNKGDIVLLQVATAAENLLYSKAFSECCRYGTTDKFSLTILE